MFDFNALTLSRLQFAFTISFHIIFPAFTIGLASWLALLEVIWVRSRSQIYKDLYKFWVKIFAVTFGMGVVSGVVLSYELGTNWAGFTRSVGYVLGPLMSFEVMAAFFLEASFLGIMLFGWDKVSEKMHLTSTIFVAIGTLISAFWIISANSWMHTPQGFELKADGLFYPKNWFDIIFNPSFPFRFIHMVTAAYLTTAFVVGGVASYYLFNKRYIEHARVMLTMAMIMAVFVAPLQILFGDAHGLNTQEHQPVKVAAMEGLWDTKKSAPLTIFAIIDEENETNSYTLEIPKLASIILKHDPDGEVLGLKNWRKEDRPPVKIVFYAFRVMVGIGFLMAFTGMIALFLYKRKRLFASRLFQLWCMAMTPAGFIAVLAGWFVTETGRQPYVVYGFLRTSHAFSNVPAEVVSVSLLAFIIVYSAIFGAGTYYILKLLNKGPISGQEGETYGAHGVDKSKVIEEIITAGEKNV